MKVCSFKKESLMLAIVCIVFANLSHAGSEDKTAICDGNWHIELKTQSSTSEKKGQRGVWIPGTIYLDRALAQCAKEIVIKQPQGGEPLLRGTTSVHRYELKNTSRQSINTTGRNNYILPVLGQRKINLWAYIPNGKDFYPGSYLGILDVELKSDINTIISTTNYSFNFQVEAYVRAKIANSNDSWLPPTGTSIRVHLGNLTQKNRKELPLFIESNSYVGISMSSLNKGHLVNITNKKNKVPYQLLFRGQQVNLLNDAEFNINNRFLNGQKMSITFQNNPMPFARAGYYEDIITINLFAK
ncbi:hypothetical protein L1D44_13480 [Shewanella sp. Isolate13]|uniref:hypothetical protein n=1 Tax=Shewanella sp. Isolate13 TaxID=2908531 RepID=UPI001EFC9E8E|nr:hypothetical protein [Shewanella sp. Isolate13]MCG9730840.1 hypothetical protein [Shewanella sp. Isolate13]